MKFIVSLIVGLGLCVSLLGQNTFDLITITGRLGLPQSYTSTYDGKATEYGTMVSLAAPIQLTEKTMWFNSVNYFYWNVSNDETMPNLVKNPIDIHGFILRTGMVRKLSKDRELMLLFVPRLMSDLNNINGDHFQFGGIAMFKKKYSEQLSISYGAMYNQELFGPYLVPLVDLNWQLSERWSISGLLPVSSKIRYKVSERFNAGLAHFGLITSYKLGTPENTDDYMERQSIDLTLFGRYNVVGNFYLEGRFGHTFGRTYAQYGADQKVDFSLPLVGFGDNRVQKNVSFQDGLIAELRLVYSVPIPGS